MSSTPAPGTAADYYATGLGARVLAPEGGSVVVELVLEERHLNDLGVAHGGAVFSLADIALSVAATAEGQRAIVSTATIHFLRPAGVGDTLRANARPVRRGGTLGVWEVDIEMGSRSVAHVIGQSVDLGERR